MKTEAPPSLSQVADNWFLLALAEQNWPEAEQALKALGTNPFWGDGGIHFDRDFGEGLLARGMHDDARARRAFTAARATQQPLEQKQRPDYPVVTCTLAVIDAFLGNKDVALQEGRRVLEATAADKSSGVLTWSFHAGFAAYFALIAAWAGEKELALQQLASVSRKQEAQFICGYGTLKLLPFWDLLRGDRRFEQIVASLAPKYSK